MIERKNETEKKERGKEDTKHTWLFINNSIKPSNN